MNKFLLLLKLQLKGSMNPKKLFHMSDRNKWGGAILLCLTALMMLVFCGASGMYAYAYATMLEPMGALSLIPGMWMAITCILTLFTTIFKVKGTLFSFSDYDMVMSMPVSTTTIVASRIAVLYLYDLMFTVIVLLPANIVYGIYTNAGVGYYILSTILMFMVPFVPILLGTLLGLVVSIAATKFRYTNLATILFMIVFLCAYLVFMMKASTSEDPEALFTNIANVITEQMNRIYPLTKLYVEAVTEFEWSAIAIFLGSSVGIFAVFCFVVGKFFKKINTMAASTKAKSSYRLKELKTSHAMGALYQREMKRYFASPMVVMNTTVGILLLTVANIVLFVSGKEKLVEMIGVPQLVDQIPTYAPVLVFLCTMMTCTTASTISLEGKNLWILKSLPVTPKQVFVSKAMVNLTLTLPFVLIDTLLLGITFQMSILQIMVMLALPTAGAFFISFFGLILNLCFPRFDWKSEMEVVKQGIPTFIAIFGGMILGILPIGICFLFASVPPELILLACAVLFALLTVGLYQYIIKKGSSIFISL